MILDLFTTLQGQDPRVQALVGGLFTLLVTASGAALVVFARKPLGEAWLHGMLAFASTAVASETGNDFQNSTLRSRRSPYSASRQ